MKCATYQIGEVADLVGVSRDTLRHYEKIGLLAPQKAENGYRYYTDSDIHNLISILYRRKMNLGLDAIKYSYHMFSDASFDNLLCQQIAAEEQEIRRHRQNIARLNLTHADLAHFHSVGDSICIEEMPASYVIVPQADMQESIRLYFEYSQKYQGLDMMYTYDEYTWQRNGGQIEAEYKNSQLVLYKELKDYVDYDIPDEALIHPEHSFCLSAACVSSSRTPDFNCLLPLLDWAASQELKVSNQLYCTSCGQSTQDGEQTWYLLLYLPVF